MLTFNCLKVRCDEFQANDLSDYRQAHCEYSLSTGDQICDCRNQNKVECGI